MSLRCFYPALAACAMLLLAACAGPAATTHQLTDSDPRAALLDGTPFGVAPQDQLQPVELTAVNDDMRAFLHKHVPEGLGDQRKVQLILKAILEEGLDLDYNNFKTFTAEEAFYTREGNCMSFTNLFVALAREAGVDAWYQEVEVPPTWAARGNTWLYNLHINALVKLPATEQVVDFNIESYNKLYHRRRLEDGDALARYHNNMGVHWMSEKSYDQAFLHFREAVSLRPDTGYFWTNLGTLYRRAGEYPRAEAAFLKAIELSSEPTAMSNLARLYRQTGRDERADYYEARVQLYRRRNPYYLFHLAEEAYAAADYQETQRLMVKAIQREDREHQFHRLLGLSQMKQGELEAAEESFLRAAELADAADRERYNNKLRLLAGS